MTTRYDSDLARKLNIRSGMSARVIGLPAGVELPGLAMVDTPAADALIAFVVTLADADAVTPEVVRAASRGAITWMAYPKARQLGTDLNRDILYQHIRRSGVEGVRQVAIDDTWSAMRFKRSALAEDGETR